MSDNRQLLSSQLKNTAETEEIEVTDRMSFINNVVKPNPLFKLNTWTRDLLHGQLFSVLVQQISKVTPKVISYYQYCFLHFSTKFAQIRLELRRNRPFALRGHVTSFLWKWKLYDFFFQKRLVGHIFKKIIVIWFFKPSPFS